MFAAPLVLCLIFLPPSPESLPPQAQQDLRTLGWQTPFDPALLLQRVRFQTLTDGERTEAERRIEQLSAPGFRDRERALRELALGSPGIDPLLRRRLADADPERKRRLEQALRHPRGRWSPDAAEAVIRLIRETRPEGAAETLLDFLPYADDLWVAQETVVTLRALGVDSERIAPRAAQAGLAGNWNVEQGPADQARAVARRFFASLASQDRDELRRLCGLPFLVGFWAIETDAELEEVYDHAAEGYKSQGKMMSLAFGPVVRGGSWAKLLDEDESRAVSRLSEDRLRMVQVRMRVDVRREEQGFLLVELRADGARVVGLLNAPRRR